MSYQAYKRVALSVLVAQPFFAMQLEASEQSAYSHALMATNGEANTRNPSLLLAQLTDEFSVANAVVKPGEKIPLKVTVNLTQYLDTAFVMFLGIPDDFKLSSGVKTKNSWAVSLRDLSGLNLIAPPSFEGALEIDVVLVRGRDGPMDRQSMIALVKPEDGATDRSARAEASPNPGSVEAESETASLPRLPVEMTAEDNALLDRGDQLLATGDVAAARLLFRRLAKKGVAIGAMRMAKSYDPEFLNTIPTAGLQPDLAQARKWYQKASELGNQDATRRLTTMSAAEPKR